MRRVRGAVLLILLVAVPAGAAVVVESVRAGSPAAEVLAKGDILAGVLGPSGLEPLETSWGLREYEDLSGRDLVFLAFRNGRELVVRLPDTDHGLRVSPHLAHEDGAAWTEAKRILGGRRTAPGARALGRLACSPALSAEVRAWLHSEAAWNFDSAEDAGIEDELAAAERDSAEVPWTRRWLLMTAGMTRFDVGRFPEALATFRLALAAHRAANARSLFAAEALNQIGILSSRSGDPDGAGRAFREALAVSSDLVPGSLDEASARTNLAIHLQGVGEYGEAEGLLRSALAVKERRAPASRTLMNGLVALGNLAHERGDHVEALRWLGRARETGEAGGAAARSLDLAVMALAEVELERGDLSAAEASFEKGLELRRPHHREDSFIASAYDGLARVAAARGELAEAESLFLRSLAVHTRLAPCSPPVAASLSDLARLAALRGNRAEARGLFEEAGRILASAQPDGADAAALLGDLAREARLAGNPVAAESLATEAFLRQERRGLRTAAARSLVELGLVAEALGDLPLAEERLTDAALRLEALAPASEAAFEAAQALGRVRARAGRREDAVRSYLRAIDVLESLQARLGGSPEARAEWRSTRLACFREAARILVGLGRPDEAFRVVERGRARELAAILSGRALRFDADIPAPLDRERREIAADRRRLRALAEADDAGAEAAGRRLARLDVRSRELERSIRATSPRLAALEYPEPADPQRLRELLGPGDLALAWQVGERDTLLFAISRERTEVVTLPSGRERLSQLADRLLRRASQPVPPETPFAAEEVSRLLSDAAFGPVGPLVAGAGRLVLVPDGPLRRIPFAIVAEPGPGTFRPLVERHAITAVPSVSALAALRARPAAGAAESLLALGDPDYGSSGSDPLREGLSALPATRDEILGLRRIWGDAATTYLGGAAGECAVRSGASAARRIHLACHGLVEERRPLESALLLSLPRDVSTDDDGRIEAWEVFEQLRLDAELVVLSACRTGVGAEIEGEGLVGLTRAFLHAGAESVVSSLWNVADESTSVLMERFHERLAAGVPRDEALRAAQLAVRTLAPNPFHWGAFVLEGDWK